MSNVASDSLINKIQGLMRLSDSPVAGEAAAAAAKVQELLFKYNLSMSEVIKRDVKGEEIPVITNRIYFPVGDYSRTWRIQIMSIIARGYYCKPIILGGFRGQPAGYIFVGRQHNVVAATEICQWVIDQLIIMCDASAKARRVKKTTWKFRSSFYAGAIDELERRINQLLRDQESGESSSTALVLVKDAAIKKYMSCEFPNLRKSRPTQLNAGNSGAYGDGREAGKNMNWNGAIGGGSGKSVPALN